MDRSNIELIQSNQSVARRRRLPVWRERGPWPLPGRPIESQRVGESVPGSPSSAFPVLSPVLKRRPQPTLTIEQIRGHLHALVKALPLQPGLKAALPGAIDVLSRDTLELFLRIVTRHETRWKLLKWLTPSIGSAQALAVVSQLPDQEMPPGLRMGESFRKAKSLRMAPKGRT